MKLARRRRAAELARLTAECERRIATAAPNLEPMHAPSALEEELSVAVAGVVALGPDEVIPPALGVLGRAVDANLPVQHPADVHVHLEGGHGLVLATDHPAVKPEPEPLWPYGVITIGGPKATRHVQSSPGFCLVHEEFGKGLAHKISELAQASRNDRISVCRSCFERAGIGRKKRERAAKTPP